MKVGIIVNGSGPLYTDAAMALGHLFDNCVVVGQEVVSSTLHDCDMFVVIGNYFRNYEVKRAGPAKKYVFVSLTALVWTILLMSLAVLMLRFLMVLRTRVTNTIA